MSSNRKYLVKSITDYDVKTKKFCVQWESKFKSRHQVSWEPLENLYCPDLLLQFEARRASGRSETPKEIATFDEHISVQWGPSDIQILKINKAVLQLVREGHKVLSTENLVVPSASHTMEELATLCPQFKHFQSSAFQLPLFQLPMLPDACVIDDGVISPLRLQLQYVMQSCEESVNFLVVNALTTGLELLGKTNFTIQQQKYVTKDYKEDIAIIQLAQENAVVALIEVAFSVNSSLVRVTSHKLAECLLYAYYELKKPERKSYMIYSALTDFYTWHIFEVKVDTSNPSLTIEKYYTFLHPGSQGKASATDMKPIMTDIVKFLNLCCK